MNHIKLKLNDDSPPFRRVFAVSAQRARPFLPGRCIGAWSLGTSGGEVLGLTTACASMLRIGDRETISGWLLAIKFLFQGGLNFRLKKTIIEVFGVGYVEWFTLAAPTSAQLGRSGPEAGHGSRFHQVSRCLYSPLIQFHCSQTHGSIFGW